MISINNFSISFSKTLILEDISFDVQKGEIVTLLGKSGCGKTTVLRAIAGLQRHHEGNICIGQECVSSDNVFKQNREVGYIFQDYALFPHLNVQENIGFPLDNLTKKDKENRVDELLIQFDIKEHSKKQIHQLSGGQQQRVAIARAMANKPKILLLDEPFANLDTHLRNKTKTWLKKLIKDNDLSAILVTHDKKEALNISDKIGIINNKKLLQFDNTHEVFNNPKNFYVANFLSDINILPKEISNELGIKYNEEYIAIFKTKDCLITQEKKPHIFEIDVVDKSYCGDYYEVLFKFKNLQNNNQELIQLDCVNIDFIDNEHKLYLDINAQHVKTVKK
ncbi:MAG: ABC transporter ATP-binding protein [Campylobacterota bacterium]